MAGNKLTVLSAGTFIRGDLYSQDVLVVEGGIEGNIVGNRVIIKNKGWVHGNLLARSLCIEPGGVVDGAMKVHEQAVMTAGEGGAMERLPEGQSQNLIEVQEGEEPRD
ncbi:MAG: polymer-forming cytoskeletal protein [Desulfarculus sp.]|nr:polymer-forming cytoskeletal protein [Desulfarculus sp.]